jgi:hypothetical protein
MAKKQTRRSISVSRGTYERLKAYCETNQISMSQFVERRVGDYLGRSGVNTGATAAQPAAAVPSAPAARQVPAPAAVTPAAPVRTDAFEVAPLKVAAEMPAPAPASRVGSERPATAPIPTPVPSRMSSINQPLSQAVSAPTQVAKPSSDEPMLKDPDAKLTADQIFTF